MRAGLFGCPYTGILWLSILFTVLYDIACSRFKFSIAAVDILVSNYLTSDDLE